MKAVLFASATVLALSYPALAQTVPARGAADSAAVPSNGEIVVTAQRREQTLLSVPLSIQASSGEKLAQQGIGDISSLQFTTPGFQPASTSGFVQIFIRGIGNSLATVDPSVATFIDDVPRIYGTAADNLNDIQRVEVLKGAQGGLYGRNATGGVINIITRQPATDAVHGDFRASYGEKNTLRLAGYVSGPVNDRIALSLAAERGHAPRLRPQSRGQGAIHRREFPERREVRRPDLHAAGRRRFLQRPDGPAAAQRSGFRRGARQAADQAGRQLQDHAGWRLLGQERCVRRRAGRYHAGVPPGRAGRPVQERRHHRGAAAGVRCNPRQVRGGDRAALTDPYPRIWRVRHACMERGRLRCDLDHRLPAPAHVRAAEFGPVAGDRCPGDRAIPGQGVLLPGASCRLELRRSAARAGRRHLPRQSSGRPDADVPAQPGAQDRRHADQPARLQLVGLCPSRIRSDAAADADRVRALHARSQPVAVHVAGGLERALGRAQVHPGGDAQLQARRRNALPALCAGVQDRRRQHRGRARLFPGADPTAASSGPKP